MANCIIVFYYIVQKKLGKILDELSKNPYLRFKRGENEFEIGVKKMLKETHDIPLPPDVKKEKLAQYASSAFEDPQEAIWNSWQDLENTAKETIGLSYTQPFELEYALKNYLPDDKSRLFARMKDLRNKSIHVPPSDVSSGTAVEFSMSALKLSNYLKAFNEKNNT